MDHVRIERSDHLAAIPSQKTGEEEITTQYSLYQSSEPIKVNDINSSESITDAMGQIDSDMNKVINFQMKDRCVISEKRN